MAGKNDSFENFTNDASIVEQSINELDDDLVRLRNISYEEISIDIDKEINGKLDECFEKITKLSSSIDKESYKNDYIQCLLKINFLKDNLSTKKESINSVLTFLWRQKINSEIEKINALHEENNQFIAKNNDLRDQLVGVQNNSKDMLAKINDTQHNINDSFNKYITIIALLVSLIAIIFGNVCSFISTSTTWQTVAILNCSLLLASCIIFTIVENIFILTSRISASEDASKKMKCHQIILNVTIGIICLALIAAIVCILIYAK